ncbi:unnamed protein product [Lymnaea stagnalis]|uniref:SOCS box domain-containing protein n=1 Tax=Lymnaea stagnalis TaxID=6523 RepID=A0AAV2I4F0_LYMST
MKRNTEQGQKESVDNRLLVQYASVNNILLVQDAIDNGADVNLIWQGQTALFFATQHCNLEMLKLLLQAGAKPSAINKDGLTPLHKACEKGAYDIVQLLIDAGSDVNVSSKYGRTPLLYAVQYGNLALVLLLLKYKANINAVGRSLGAFTERNCAIEQWCTPLGQASKMGQSDYILALVEAGARLTDVLIMVNVLTKERKSFTAFDVSLSHSDLNVLSYLIKNGAAIKPVCYAGSGSHFVWSEASCSVITALQGCHLSEEFLCKVLFLLTQTGFSIQKDSYCKDLIKSYKRKSDHENKKCDRDLLLDILTEISVGNFSNACQKLFASTNCTHSDRSKTVQLILENSSNVNTLLAKCRIRIRNRLSLVNHRRALGPLIERLPLPNQLLQYLMLEC